MLGIIYFFAHRVIVVTLVGLSLYALGLSSVNSDAVTQTCQRCVCAPASCLTTAVWDAECGTKRICTVVCSISLVEPSGRYLVLHVLAILSRMRSYVVTIV